MPDIREFNVIDPLTGGEVKQRALEALQASGVLRITLLGQEEVPPPYETTVEFRIVQTTHPEDGSMKIAGPDIEGNSVVVSVPEDPTIGATASMVV